MADRVIPAGLAADAADGEAASAEVAAAGSRRRAGRHRDDGRLQAPQRPPRNLDHRYGACPNPMDTFAALPSLVALIIHRVLCSLRVVQTCM